MAAEVDLANTLSQLMQLRDLTVHLCHREKPFHSFGSRLMDCLRTQLTALEFVCPHAHLMAMMQVSG